MRPIKFKDQNSIFAENQDQYGNLPSLKIEGEDGNVISCWKLSLFERMRLLIFGKIWLNVTTFNKPLQPILMSTKRKDIYSKEDDLSFKKLYSKLNRFMFKILITFLIKFFNQYMLYKTEEFKKGIIGSIIWSIIIVSSILFIVFFLAPKFV